ncbi:SHOCT domain-containing protein [Haloterrigena sp. SYSU A558-1]|uniref:SHOCT domain-containing protein n=1 Tax=Haloterrigena gelatinilytica TaxID=2741724 RepID=A0ABX2LIT9_9EURY|nr:SHOCT domain-containing protein [Haloterrigena gelatinilytica]NUC74460.1 SHOCT domain-containing protein [Haloterrigena gelatinilytica]
MPRLGSLLLKSAGALLLAFIALSVIATVVGIVLSVVATVVTAVATLAMLAVVVLAAVGLVSLLRDDGGGDGLETEYGRDGARSTDVREERLRSQYVDGELSEAEFERELDRLLEDGNGRTDGLDARRSRDSTTDRTRLWDR